MYSIYYYDFRTRFTYALHTFLKRHAVPRKQISFETHRFDKCPDNLTAAFIRGI